MSDVKFRRTKKETPQTLEFTAFLELSWWALQDSNLRPPGYEPEALTN